MSIIEIVALSLIQGLTEFLPISSTAHLILLPKLMHWQDPGLAFDVSVHLGTLLAVISYFRRDLYIMLKDGYKFFTHNTTTPHTRILIAVAFGTIPVGIFGLFLHKFIANDLRTPFVIAMASLVFAFLLAYAVITAKQQRDEYSITPRDVFFIGMLQALALIPGVSRSGITITGGLLAGLKPKAAARYAFLLGIPVILLAGGLEMKSLLTKNVNILQTDLLLAFGIAAVSAYACIHVFMLLLEKIGYMPFVVYRILLSLFLLVTVTS